MAQQQRCRDKYKIVIWSDHCIARKKVKGNAVFIRFQWRARRVSVKWPLALRKCHMKCRDAIMTSSNGNIFRVTSRSPVNSPHKRQWRGALIFSFICVFINDWVNNRKTADLRRYRTHYDGTVITLGPISYRALKSDLLGHSLLWLRKWVPLSTQNVISRL